MERLTDEQRERAAGALPLVKWLARQYPRMGEWDDRVQDGMLGAMRATQRYEPGKARWSTFAAHHIKGAMLDGYRSRERSRVRARLDVREVPLEDPELRVEPEPGPEEVVTSDALVIDLLERMSPEDRRLVLARVSRQQNRLGDLLGVTESRIAQVWRRRAPDMRERARRALES